MAVKVGINGFGRTGRLTLRAAMEMKNKDIDIVAVNSTSDAATKAHLFKWDSSYGKYPGAVVATKDSIIVDGKPIKSLTERDPAKLPWKDLGVQIALECTGEFADAEKAAFHLIAGAKKVIISAPSRKEDITVVLGVNEDKYDPAKHKIISNASCTTNALAPVVKVLHQAFGVEKGLLNTVHSYTNDQRVLDMSHRDLRRARTAGMNIIPTTTGAARTVAVVMPELKGKLDGIALRIPTPTVSICDFTCLVKKPTVTIEEVNNAFKAAAEGPMKGILEYVEEPLVSMDFKGNPASSIIDAKCTMVLDNNLVKVFAWYDNEWGYSCRMVDITAYVIKRGL